MFEEPISNINLSCWYIGGVLWNSFQPFQKQDKSALQTH
jgi:hypothetical protein